MSTRQSLFGCIHALLWIITLWIVEFVFSESPARSAYALLCAWWINLYGSLYLSTTWRALPALVITMLVAFGIQYGLRVSYMYHDLPAVSSTEFIVVLATLIVLWSSPILVNQGLVALRRRPVGSTIAP
jgi:ABC-type arginine transport system permease subunit